jgi:hypothetical protein
MDDTKSEPGLVTDKKPRLFKLVFNLLSCAFDTGFLVLGFVDCLKSFPLPSESQPGAVIFSIELWLNLPIVV